MIWAVVISLVAWMDTRHRIIAVEPMARGTIDRPIPAHLKQSLALVVIRVPDQIVAGETCVSLDARRWV
ncbi:hypothetical protein [Thermomonas fusca]